MIKKNPVWKESRVASNYLGSKTVAIKSVFRSSVVFTPEVHVELIQFVSALEVIPF